MRIPLLIAASLGAAACAPVEPGPGPDREDSFAQETAGRAAGQPQSCVSQFGNQGLRIVNRQTVAYGSGKTIYVNRLRAPCYGLRPMNTIIVESSGGQYCSGDHIRGVEPGAITPGAVCLLGDWTAYRKP